LNEILNGCQWCVDDAHPSEDDMADVGENVIEELLSDLLTCICHSSLHFSKLALTKDGQTI
jgi:hypothetical protein